ncbi:MAG: polysaccharide deacetylase family protein [Lachnospiraceae bacterium]|nr:polysaccharide deacetylase family protein [Lachnospiraceae bacterium]
MDSQEIEKLRAKRKRVKRMKTFIVTFITTWILVSILAICFLSFKVFSLQRQLNELSSKIDSQQSSALNYNDGDSDSAVLANYSASAEENLAQAGDTLKVYLTFDDGPSENSNAILDILDDYNVKATFFVVGREDEDSLAVYKRIVDEGHTIAMHSYSHSYSNLYSSLDAFKSDLERIQNLIYDATGVDCDLYRFPGGSSNQVSNADMTEYIKYLNDENIRYLDWNVASGDATSVAYSADDLVENVMTDVVKYKTSVVLMHDADNKDATVEALPKLIEQLQGIGAVILPVSEDTEMIQHVTIATENE